MQEILDRSIKHHSIVKINSHGEHRLDHGSIPVSIGSRMEVLNLWIENRSQHLGETVLIFAPPRSVGMPNELSGITESDAAHADQQPCIVT